MPLSLYAMSIPPLISGLNVLSKYLDAAAAFVEENKTDASTLLDARLAPDMQPFSAQIQRASDTSKGALARLTGKEMPSFPDTETSIPELKERIAKTIRLLESVTPQEIDDSQDRVLNIKFGSYIADITGSQFVITLLLPNFFFHVTTAHDILRNKGLKIGKKDYLALE